MTPHDKGPTPRLGPLPSAEAVHLLHISEPIPSTPATTARAFQSYQSLEYLDELDRMFTGGGKLLPPHYALADYIKYLYHKDKKDGAVLLLAKFSIALTCHELCSTQEWGECRGNPAGIQVCCTRKALGSSHHVC